MSNRSKQQQNQIKIAIYGVLYFMVLNRLILRPLFTPQSKIQRKIQLKISLIMVDYPVMKLTDGHMTRLCFIKISLDYDLDQNCAQISFLFYFKTLEGFQQKLSLTLDSFKVKVRIQINLKTPSSGQLIQIFLRVIFGNYGSI